MLVVHFVVIPQSLDCTTSTIFPVALCYTLYLHFDSIFMQTAQVWFSLRNYTVIVISPPPPPTPPPSVSSLSNSGRSMLYTHNNKRSVCYLLVITDNYFCYPIKSIDAILHELKSSFSVVLPQKILFSTLQ